MSYKIDNNARMADYMRERYHRRKQQAFELLGGCCVLCGSQDDLEIDHIDPALKTMSVARMCAVSEEKFLKELEICQLLCNTHHIEKSRAEKSVSHGGGASGKKNCPCQPCRAKKSEYMRGKAYHKNKSRLRS